MVSTAATESTPGECARPVSSATRAISLVHPPTVTQVRSPIRNELTTEVRARNLEIGGETTSHRKYLQCAASQGTARMCPWSLALPYVAALMG